MKFCGLDVVGMLEGGPTGLITNGSSASRQKRVTALFGVVQRKLMRRE